ELMASTGDLAFPSVLLSKTTTAEKPTSVLLRSRSMSSRILLVSLLLFTAGLQAQVGNVLQLEPFKFTGSRAHASADASPNPVDRLSPDDLENSGVFRGGEFLAQLPPSPKGRQQLVLIDGHPTFLNPADLPPGMIESVEVSRYGAMPQYGAYARG